MAEINDIAYKIVADIANVVNPLVGTTYAMPEYVDLTGTVQPTPDLLAYGQTRTVPNCTIFPSRPMLSQLTERMTSGKASISIEVGNHDVPRQQYTNKPETQVGDDALTLNAEQSGDTVTLSGVVTPGNVIGLQCGDSSTSYLVKAGDTLAGIATGLQTAAVGDNFFPISTNGASFTVNVPASSPPLQVNLGTTSTWIRPVSYRRRFFDALIWTPNPYDRQFFGRYIETLYDLGQRLPMVDGTVATIMDIPGAIDHDQESAEGVLIRRVRWVIDFTSVVTFTKTTIVATFSTLAGVFPGGVNPGYTDPIASQL